MGVDEMQEALNLGFIETEGKGTFNVSSRFTHDMVQAIDSLSAMDDIKRSEWIRDACIEKLLRLKRQHEYLSKAFGGSTNTENTSNTQQKSPSAGTDELHIQLGNTPK